MAVKPPRGVKPNIEFPQVMLAPIAGVTDRATRDIARMHGCPLTFSELISARGIKEGGRGSVQMIEECRDEHPLIVQIFGSEPDSIYDSIRILDDMGVDGVNLNLGCPVKKVFKNGSGCGLTVFPTQLVYVIREMRRATDLHVSVKIRGGVNLQSLNYRLIGDIAQGEGCDAIILHARTRMMGFGGEAQWNWIGDLKQYLDIPVIGNGDVVDAVSAKRMLDQTGCDGVMIGRGSYGNPWVFREVIDYLESGKIHPAPSLDQRLETLKQHMERSAKWKGEKRGTHEMRKQFSWYVKGYRNIRPLREKVFHLETLNEIFNAIDEWAELTRNQQHESYEITAPIQDQKVSLQIA